MPAPGGLDAVRSRRPSGILGGGDASGGCAIRDLQAPHGLGSEARLQTPGRPPARAARPGTHRGGAALPRAAETVPGTQLPRVGARLWPPSPDRALEAAAG